MVVRNTPDQNLTILGFNSAIPQLNSLAEVYFSNSTFDNSVLLSLSKNCPKLRYIDAGSCNKLGAEGLVGLPNCKNLTGLNLAYCISIGDSHVDPIAQISNLTDLSLEVREFESKSGE